jgi:hypothetical protein
MTDPKNGLPRKRRKPKPPKIPAEQARTGRPSKYHSSYPKIARHLCAGGATDHELAQAFGVATSTIYLWAQKNPEFSEALKVHKGEFDARVERALAARAVGYTYRAMKVFTHFGKPVHVPYLEHVPPDVGAIKLWLTNRRPDEWRDVNRVELDGRIKTEPSGFDMAKLDTDELLALAQLVDRVSEAERPPKLARSRRPRRWRS